VSRSEVPSGRTPVDDLGHRPDRGERDVLGGLGAPMIDSTPMPAVLASKSAIIA
jgi:hypothetical protein